MSDAQAIHQVESLLAQASFFHIDIIIFFPTHVRTVDELRHDGHIVILDALVSKIETEWSSVTKLRPNPIKRLLFFSCDFLSKIAFLVDKILHLDKFDLN